MSAPRVMLDWCMILTTSDFFYDALLKLRSTYICNYHGQRMWTRGTTMIN